MAEYCDTVYQGQWWLVTFIRVYLSYWRVECTNMSAFSLIKEGYAERRPTLIYTSAFIGIWPWPAFLLSLCFAVYFLMSNTCWMMILVWLQWKWLLREWKRKSQRMNYRRNTSWDRDWFGPCNTQKVRLYTLYFFQRPSRSYAPYPLDSHWIIENPILFDGPI